MDGLTLFLLFLAAAVGAVVAWFFLRGATARTQETEEKLFQRFDRFQVAMEQRMDASRTFLADRVSATEKTARELSQHFGHLREASQTLLKTNTEILDFQKMLSAPSARGGFGEMLLESLLRDILPADRYELQHVMKNGFRADAIIRLNDGYVVAVDAKFPLAGYEPLIRAGSDSERAIALRSFAGDVKRHAKDIAEKYISPTDHTLSFAFMYIPTEGVYYEIVRNPDLWNAVTALRIYPVSPNSLVPYMYTILVGLKGLQVEKEAKEILGILGKLQKDFSRVSTEFSKVGTHLEQALNRYDDAAKVFDRLRGRVDSLGNDAEKALPEESSPLSE